MVMQKYIVGVCTVLMVVVCMYVCMYVCMNWFFLGVSSQVGRS